MWARRLMACSLMADRRPGLPCGEIAAVDVAILAWGGGAWVSVSLGLGQFVWFTSHFGEGQRAGPLHTGNFGGGRAGARLGRWAPFDKLRAGSAPYLRQIVAAFRMDTAGRLCASKIENRDWREYVLS